MSRRIRERLGNLANTLSINNRLDRALQMGQSSLEFYSVAEGYVHNDDIGKYIRYI